MNKKKIAAFIGIILLGVILFPLLNGKDDKPLNRTDHRPHYIFDKTSRIRLNDVKEFRKKTNFNAPIANRSEGNKYPMDKVTPETLKYFKYLQKKFKTSNDLESHFEQAREFVFLQLSYIPQKDLNKLLVLYRNYLQSEMDIADMFSLQRVSSPEELIEYLKKIQDFRRERLGEEIADALFGTEVKTKEYALRRSAIVENKSLYGSEKEAMIMQLNQDMWGDEAEAVNQFHKPYNRYLEKLSIYQRDLQEMESQADRQMKVQEFREELFPPEIVEKLEAIDQRLKDEEAAENRYRQEENKILKTPDLSEKEKREMILNLQDEIFQEEAEAFRRREKMRMGSLGGNSGMAESAFTD